MKPYEVVDSIRSQYGSLNFTVYDRSDRWQLEHRNCISTDHHQLMEGGVVVYRCTPSKSVLILDVGTPLSRSRCGRCLTYIGLNEMVAFLESGHLCEECSEHTDAEHAESVVESERATTDESRRLTSVSQSIKTGS